MPSNALSPKLVNHMKKLFLARFSEDVTLKEKEENGLVDTGSATKDLLQKVQVSAERKRKFKGECKQLVLGTLFKLQEMSPLKYSIVRNGSCLAPVNIIRKPEECAIRFQSLADKLYVVKRISATKADNSKSQYEDMSKLAKYEQRENFKKLYYKEDHIRILWSFYFK